MANLCESLYDVIIFLFEQTFSMRLSIQESLSITPKAPYRCDEGLAKEKGQQIRVTDLTILAWEHLVRFDSKVRNDKIV